MGELMGAKDQMWQGTLSHEEGKTNTGTIIVRFEALNESNLVAEFSACVLNANNRTTGCFGICCTDIFAYHVEV